MTRLLAPQSLGTSNLIISDRFETVTEGVGWLTQTEDPEGLASITGSEPGFCAVRTAFQWVAGCCLLFDDYVLFTVLGAVRHDVGVFLRHASVTEIFWRMFEFGI